MGLLPPARLLARVAQLANDFAQTGFFRPDEQWQARFGELFGQIVDAGQGRALFRTVGDKPAGTAAAAADGGDQRIAASPLDNRVREACQYISDHLADSHFDIASVAQHVCLSPSRLSHLFRQQLGSASSAGGRISASAKAKLLLSTTRMPIATVGRNVGFEDQLYFSRVFKNAPGPASEFRAGCE